MPVELLEAVASSGELPERTPPRLGTLVHLRGCKSLIYKHSIIILFFQGTQIKAYKYANACGWNRTSQTTASQKGRRLYALIQYIFCNVLEI